jgi:hypothetical protein
MPPVVSNSLKSVCHTLGNVGRMNPCLAQGCDGFVSGSPSDTHTIHPRIGDHVDDRVLGVIPQVEPQSAVRRQPSRVRARQSGTDVTQRINHGVDLGVGQRCGLAVVVVHAYSRHQGTSRTGRFVAEIREVFVPAATEGDSEKRSEAVCRADVTVHQAQRFVGVVGDRHGEGQEQLMTAARPRPAPRPSAG